MTTWPTAGRAPCGTVVGPVRPRGARRVPGAGRRAARAAVEQLDPDVRAAFEVSIDRRRAGQRGRSSARPSTEVARGRRGASVTQRMIPVDRVGLYVPGGLAAAGLQRDHERGAGPGGRGRLDRGHLAAAARTSTVCRTRASSALCHLLGVEEVYAVGGAQAIAMFAYGVPGSVRPGQPDHRSRATSTSSPPSGCSRAGSTSTPRPARPRSRSWPTRRPSPVHVAADLISQAEHDPAAAAVLVTDSHRAGRRGPGRAEGAGAGGQARRADQRGSDRHAVGRGAGRRSRPGDRRRQRVRRRAPGAPHRRAAGRRRPDPQRRRDLRRAPGRRCRSGDYSAGSTHVLPTAGCACHSSGLNVKSFLKAVHVVDYDRRGAARGRPARRGVRRGRGPAAHGAAVTARRSLLGSTSRPSLCRSGPSWSARSRTGRRSWTCRYCLNVNENPYPPSDQVAAEIAAAVATAARTHEPLSGARRRGAAGRPGRATSATV